MLLYQEMCIRDRHCINPVDSRAIGMEKPKTLVQEFDDPADVIIFDGFKDKAKVAFGIGTFISNDTDEEALNIVMKLSLIHI